MRAFALVVLLTACGGTETSVESPVATNSFVTYPPCLPQGWDCETLLVPQVQGVGFVCVGCIDGTTQRWNAYVDRFGTCSATLDTTFVSSPCP